MQPQNQCLQAIGEIPPGLQTKKAAGKRGCI